MSAEPARHLTNLVGTTSETSQLLGWVALYGVPQTLVDAKGFSQACVDLGIPAPRPIEGVDAFKRATRRVEARRVPIGAHASTYYNLLVREVPSTESRTFRELVREVVDENGKRLDQTALSHRSLLKWSYSRTMNSLTAAILEPDTMEPDLLMLAQEAINTVAMAFETEVHCYGGNVVRDTVRNYLESASAIPVKENGGAAYFIPRTTVKKTPSGQVETDDAGNPVQVESGRMVVEALNRLVVRLSELQFRLDWWDLPVVDGTRERGRVMGAVEERLHMQAITLMEKIKAEKAKIVLAREKNPDAQIPPSQVRRYTEELREILRVRSDMEALLNRTIDSIQGTVEMAEEAVEQILW